MTRDRRVPNRRRVARSSQLEGGQLSPSSLSRRVPSPRKLAGEAAANAAANSQVSSTTQPLGNQRRSRRNMKASEDSSLGKNQQSGWQRWLKSWHLWALMSVLTLSGVGWVAVAMLLRLPSLPNCPKIFWPTASASLRLYCAEVAANKETVDDLLSAIALVNELDADHPLRPEINRNIARWAMDIFELGEKAFQAGKLDDAIAIARQVPNVPQQAEESVSISQLVSDQIKKWQGIWSQAEKIYQASENELRQENWRLASEKALSLLAVGNTYWETTKYQELRDRIEMARVDGNKLAKARSLAEAGGLDNLLAAVKLAEEITKQSHVYDAAQATLKKFGRQMMDLAEAKLEAKDLQAALAIARKIPVSTNLDKEAKDFMDLARATSKTWRATVSSLEDAIATARTLTPDRPLYSRAQRLINEWQSSITHVAHLEQARDLARSGLIPDLRNAIAKAQLVPPSSPVGNDATTEIEGWTRQIEVIEDRPYLDRSQRLAWSNDVASLEAAIDEASRIGQGRALYAEAQEKIAVWRAEVQRQQDQPFLARAESMAVQGNLDAAISTAQQIQPGRALYEEAQTSVQAWESQRQAQRSLDEAILLATPATPQALLSAIRSANRVPGGTALRAQADSSIRDWSERILMLAQDRAQYDLQGAIEVASSIPDYSPAYPTAQRQIADWQLLLSPGTLAAPPEPAPPQIEEPPPEPEQIAPPPPPEPQNLPIY